MLGKPQLALILGLAATAVLSCKSSGRSSGAEVLSEEPAGPESSVLLSNADGSYEQWSGVGRLRGALTCTAFWVKTSDNKEAPAYVVTNGHCVQEFTARAGSDTVYKNIAVTDNWTVSFRYFYDTVASQKTIKVKTIAYSTMKRTDLAVLELDATQGDLLAAGLQPLSFASTAPAADQDIRVVGVPLLPLEEAKLFLREHRCSEQGTTDVVEWFWFWSQLHRNDCADIVSGSSGSPVLDDKGEVFAVINTTTRDGNSNSCYMGNPCEIGSTGAIRRENTNYAASTLGLAKCWNSSGVWDLEQSACPLDRRNFLGVQSKTLIPTNGKDRMGKTLSWDLELTHPNPTQLRFKKGYAGRTSCEDPTGYKPFEGSKDPNFKGYLPDREGVYFACFAEAGDFKDQKLAFPTTVVLTIDKTPPEKEPFLSINYFEDGSATVEPIFAVPEYSFFRYELEAIEPSTGTEKKESCKGLTLTPYRRVPIYIAAQDLPVRFCVQGDDHAGNPGAIYGTVIGKKD